MAGVLVAKSKTERDQITVPFSLEPQCAAFKAKAAFTLLFLQDLEASEKQAGSYKVFHPVHEKIA